MKLGYVWLGLALLGLAACAQDAAPTAPVRPLDTVQADADTVTSGPQNTVNLGNVLPGAVLTREVGFNLVCAGKQHVDAGQSVTFAYAVSSSSVPAGSLTATSASTGPIPAAWPDDTTGGGSTNCGSPPPAPITTTTRSTVTLTAPTVPGAYTYAVVYAPALTAGNNNATAISGANPAATFTLTVVPLTPADVVPPVTTVALTPGSPDGLNNWYRSAVAAQVSSADNAGGSGVAETRCVLDPAGVPLLFDDLPAGCAFTGTGSGVSLDGVHTLYAASRDAAGNKEAVTSRSFNLDRTAPTITLTGQTAANEAGWNNTDVTLTWGCTDAVSGVSGVSGATVAQTLSAEGAGQSATGVCTDGAGNIASNTVSGVNIDKAAPVVEPADVTDAVWRNLPLEHPFTAADNLSGLANAADASFTLAASAESAAPDQPTTASRTVADRAGNETVRTLSALIDLSAPLLGASLSPASPDGLSGWYTSAPTVSYGCSDPLSGVAGGCPAPYTFGEGVDQNHGASVSDNAGNSSSAGVSSVNVDLTAPTGMTFSGVSSQTYYFGSVPPLSGVGCTASDALSGLASCTVSGYSDAVGSHTLTATATDRAGRQATATLSYTVSAWTLRGFYAPVDMGMKNNAKGGSTVPLKFEVFAGPTELTSTGVVKTFTQALSCTTSLGDDIEQYATGGTSLRYDAVAGQFVFNWQTPKKPGTCYRVTVETQDGSRISADFQLR